MKIVVIDSGFSLEGDYNIRGISIAKCADKYTIHSDFSDDIGHGSKVAEILFRYGHNVEMTMIKVCMDGLDDEDHTDILMYTLEYAAEHFHPDLINISMGLEYCNRHIEFAELCANIKKSGIGIIAAYSNTGSNSYPAVFDSVIGVDWCIDCVKISQYILVRCFEKMDIRCSGSIGSNSMDSRGNSFLAPYVTALINNIWEEIPDKSFANVKELLVQKAYKVIDQSPNQIMKMENHINKAVLFPYNKEIKSLLINEGQIEFDVAGIYDLKYSPCFNQKIKIGNRNYFIGNYEVIDWEQDFDTVILGHVHLLSKAVNKNLAKYFIDRCKKYNKFLYSFDDLSEYSCVTDKVFYPKVDHSLFSDLYFGKLFHVSIPILIVLGTRSRQGKFFIQQKLRENFAKKGISVGYLSTEPSGFLIGADAVYPIGYGASVRLTVAEQISYANYLLHEISKTNKDIIITGGQSQILNNAFGNIGGYPIEQYAFLLACDPDEVILCVNFDDEIDYIDRSIKFIESITDISVIALVLFHKIIESDTKEYIIEDGLLGEKRKTLEEELSKPVFRCDSSSDIECLCDIVLKDLSG